MASVDNTFPTVSDLWQTLLAFGRFELFVSPSILVIVYWFGAVGIPLLAVLFVRRLLRRLTLPDISGLHEWQRNRMLIIIIAIMMFLFAELMWRMMIETVLAWFQMRDALVNTAAF
jgi:hypothetical protein